MKFKMNKKGNSGIYIKPENRGKFTATKKATGKTTEELTHSKNPVTKKRAIFAQNAAKWKHEDGSKNVKGFPDLNKDGKITKADILKGRGVIKKSGSKSMKAEDTKMCGSKGMKYQTGSKGLVNKEGQTVTSKVTDIKPFKNTSSYKPSSLSKPDSNTLPKMNIKEANKMKMAKNGTKNIKFKKPMMKRADGSTSQRGLWDNIRANKGSGKKPTPEMLKQEKKIKAGK